MRNLREKRKNVDSYSYEDDRYPPPWGCIGQVLSSQFGCLGVVLAVLIPVIASFLVETPNSKGVEQPVIIVVIQTIFDADVPGPTEIVEISVAQTLTAIASTQPQIEPTALNTPTTTYTPLASSTPESQPTTIPTTGTYIPISGLAQCDLEEIINTTNSVADLIIRLDNLYGTYSSAGGAWSNPGFVISGPSVFWTDLFENGNNLPPNVSRIRTQGSWGVFFVQSNTTYTINSPNGGGRFFRISPDECLLSLTPIPAQTMTVTIAPTWTTTLLPTLDLTQNAATCNLATPLTAFDSTEIIPDWYNSQVAQLNINVPDGYDTLYISSDPATFNGIQSRTRLIILSQSNLLVENILFNQRDGHFNIWAMAFSNCDTDTIFNRYGLDGTDIVWFIDKQGEMYQYYP